MLRGVGRGPNCGQLQHVASFAGFNIAPTHANTFEFFALFVEVRRGIRTKQGKHSGARARKHRGTSIAWRKGSPSGIRHGG